MVVLVKGLFKISFVIHGIYVFAVKFIVLFLYFSLQPLVILLVQFLILRGYVFLHVLMILFQKLWKQNCIIIYSLPAQSAWSDSDLTLKRSHPSMS